MLSFEDRETPMTKCEESTSSIRANGDSSTSIIDKAVQELARYEEFISPRRSILEARKAENEPRISTIPTQSRHQWIDETLLQKPISPTNSISSRCTALSRARSAIAGRRKSWAAAKARASAVMDELQNSKSIAREAAKERAWAALADIQPSRSFSSRGGGIGIISNFSHEEPVESRQPISSTGLTSPVLAEEKREDVENDPVDKVISVGISQNSETRRSNETTMFCLADADEIEKGRDGGDVMEGKKKSQGKRSRDRKSRSTVRKNLQTSSDNGLQGYSKDGSALSSSNASRNGPNSSFVLSDEALMAVSQAALEVAPKLEALQLSQRQDRQDDNTTAKFTRDNNSSHKKKIDGHGTAHVDAGSRQSSTAPKKTARSPRNAAFLLSRNARTAVNQTALDTNSKIDDLRPLRREPQYKEGIEDAVEELRALKDVVQSNQATVTSNHHYIATRYRNHVENLASTKMSSSSADQNLSFLALNSMIDLKKSEDSHDELLSSSSSSVNEQIDIKPADTEDSMGEGALDKTMYQGKIPELKNDSEDSANSSYSSDHSRIFLSNKSMGPIWQKAIDDAHKARVPRPMPPLKTEIATEGLSEAGLGDTLADDETVFNMRVDFHHERMKCVAIFAVVFLVMNSLFVTLDASSVAIRAFGLVGLISSTFPLMVMWMYLLTSMTQHSFWTWSVNMLLLGCFCQGCTLITFILRSDLGAWAWAAGIISLVCLLLLTVEMNTNSPVLPPSVSGKSESSLSIGGMMKCLGLFGLGPGAVQEHSESKSRRSSRRKKKNSRLLDSGETTVENNRHFHAEYVPPVIV